MIIKAIDIKGFCKRFAEILKDDFRNNETKCAKGVGINITRVRSYTDKGLKDGERPSLPNAEILARIKKVTTRTIDWLLTGQDYSDLDNKEKKIIDLWRSGTYREIRKMILAAEERDAPGEHEPVKKNSTSEGQ